MPNFHEALDLARAIRRAHLELSRELVRTCREQSPYLLGSVERDLPGDTIFRLDAIAEPMLLQLFSQVAEIAPLVLVAEGLEGGQVVLPTDTDPSRVRWRVIVDPIDGTRGLVYQKRSAWILTAIAVNKGPETRLRDVVAAVQTEVPTIKQHLLDQLMWVEERGVEAWRLSLSGDDKMAIHPRPSTADTILHGYAMLSRFFPGARDVIAAIEERLIRELLGDSPSGKALCFEDQYASTGGQFYELAMGHDRFNGDIRPLLAEELRRRGQPLGLCCHPYDVCTAPIAQALGVIITDPTGQPLDCALDLEANVAWIGYANHQIRDKVQPILTRLLKEFGLL
ncbi:MAG: hypothetical protein NZ899_04810 [Thermoguttaceae bacterium]|nr:hypothetical protein [Thermoguttaceae bacterium]